MGLCPVSEIKPGAVLVKEVRAKNGRLIFKEGTVLTEKHILVLKSWGITKVYVDDLDKCQDKDFIDLNKELILDFFPPNVLKDSLMKRMVSLSLKWLKKSGKQVIVPFQLVNEKKNFKKIPIPKKLNLSPEKLVGSQKELCSLPNIYKKMMEVLNDPNSSAKNIGDVVSKDTSLSAKLLRIVNSPHFGLVSKVDTVSRAIALLGLDQLKLLAKGIIIIENFKNLPSDVINMTQFWRHSIGVALMSSILATTKVALSSENLFVAGLLHDVGKLIMLMAMPGLYFNLILHGKENNISLCEVEREILGFTHCDVGAILAEKWYFPLSLIEIIRYNHEPLKSSIPVDTSLVYLGDVLTQMVFHGFAGNFYIPLIYKEVLEELEIDINELELVLGNFFKQINVIESTFL